MKQWLRKTLALLCGGVMVCTTAASLTACKKPGEDSSSGSSDTVCTHQWDNGVEQIAATCTSDGSALYTCTLCNEQETRVIEGGHKYVENVVEVTCIRDGSTTKTCERCGDAYKNITARASGHNTEGATWTAAENVWMGECTYNHVETAICNDCNEKVTHTEEFVQHDWTVGITKAATCAAAGEKTYLCDECGETTTVDYTDANAHNWVESATQAVNDNVIKYECSNNAAHTKTVFSAKSSVSATVPAAALQEAGEVELQNAAIKMDDTVLQQFAGKDVDLSVEEADKNDLGLSSDELEKLGNSPVYNFEMSVENSAVTSFNSPLTITIPYNLEQGDDPSNIAIWYIDNNGQTTAIPATYSYNEAENQGYATFQTNHFSLYTVVRLSVTEYCAIYGHDYENKTVPASCNQQGYTLKGCKRCNDMSRSNFTTALTHNYKSTATVATCTERGYTTYTCDNCQDRYVTDYTEKAAHTYEAKTTAPTCTVGGYTNYTCTACHQSYVGDETAATGHTYSNGACTACGHKDPNTATGNFYLNMIESFETVDTYYLEIEDFDVTISIEETVTSKVEMDLLRIAVGFDENGLVGKGEATLKQTEGDETLETASKVVFRDGKMYCYAKATGAENEELFVVMDQTAMFNTDGAAVTVMLEQIEVMLEQNGETIDTLLSGISAVENSPLNEVFKTVTEFVYAKEETANGYKFTLNKARAKQIYNTLTTLTISEVYDVVFGVDAFDSTVTYLKNSLTKTLSAFETEATTELARWGIDKDTLYSLVYAMSGMEISELVTENAEMQLYVLLNNLAEEEATAADYEAQIDMYAGELSEMTVFELIMGMGETNAVPLVYGSNVSDASETEETTEENDFIAATIDEILEKLGNSNVVFETDKAGSIISFKVELNNFTVEDETGENVTINIKLSFIPNGNYAGEYEDVVNTAKTFETIFDFSEPIKTEMYTLFKMGDDVYLWSNRRYSNYEGDTYVSLYPTQFVAGTEEVIETDVNYNGAICTKSVIQVYNLYKANTAIIMAQKDCHGWWKIEPSELNAMDMAYVYTWKDANGEIVGMEWVEDQDWDSYYGHAELYYNPTTKTYASETQHVYKLVETIDPVGCEYGQYIYECTVCGENYEDEFGEGHDYAYKMELVAGATSCEEGAIITEYCTKCDKVLSSKKTKVHETYLQEILVGTSKECGDIYLRCYTCACGEEKYIRGFETDCLFGPVGIKWCEEVDCPYDYHYTETYRCAIGACAFTYTQEYRRGYARENGVCYCFDENVYEFDGGKTLTTTDKWSSHYSDSTYEDYEDGSYMTTWTCNLCDQVVQIVKWDSYGREIYNERPLDGYKMVRTYTGCNYEDVYTYKDGEESYSTGVQHLWSSGSDRDYCTQYYKELDKCDVCQAEKFEWRAPDEDFYEDHGHNWDKNEDGIYVCNRCGTESTTGANGWISIENMTTNGVLKAGYFNYAGIDMNDVEIKIVVNYQADGSGIPLDDVLFTKTITSPENGYNSNGDWREYREAGIITVDMDSLLAEMDGLDGVTVESVSIVFWVYQESSGDYIGHAITIPYGV